MVLRPITLLIVFSLLVSLTSLPWAIAIDNNIPTSISNNPPNTVDKPIRNCVLFPNSHRCNKQPSQVSEVKPLLRSGKGCITQIGSDGRKMDQIVPWTGQIIKGEWCVAFDLSTRKIIEEKPWSPVDPDTRLLDVRWHNPYYKGEMYYEIK